MQRSDFYVLERELAEIRLHDAAASVVKLGPDDERWIVIERDNRGRQKTLWFHDPADARVQMRGRANAAGLKQDPKSTAATLRYYRAGGR